MFTQGQLIFAVAATLIFIVTVIISYRKDKKESKSYFKNSYIVLIAFIVFIAFLFFLKIKFEVN